MVAEVGDDAVVQPCERTGSIRPPVVAEVENPDFQRSTRPRERINPLGEAATKRRAQDPDRRRDPSDPEFGETHAPAQQLLERG
jgi:hypothetical protein